MSLWLIACQDECLLRPIFEMVIEMVIEMVNVLTLDLLAMSFSLHSVQLLMIQH